jgi:two-component system sensor histidine kinase UhpB
LNDFQQAIKHESPDVLLLDLFLPGSQGLDTLTAIKMSDFYCPIIVLSGLADMQTALQSVKQGAQDYLIKDEMNEEMINKMINYAIERFANINEIRKSEEKYKLLFQSIPVAVVMLDENDFVLEMNDASRLLFACFNYEMDQSFSSFFLKNELGENELDKIKSGEPQLLKVECKLGKTKYIEFASVQSEMRSGNKRLVTLLDRTETIENQINKNRIIHETLDDERERFSKELHDGLAQYLVVLNLQLEMIKGIDSTVDKGIEKSLETLNTSIKMVRSISYNLSPPEMEKGLFAALRSFFGRIHRVNGVEFNLEIADDIDLLDLSFLDEYSIFRIIQEFTNNSLKYSQCSAVTCEVSLYKKHLRIDVQDNGTGFDIETVQKGLGLKNMSQRAFAAGFKFELNSKPGSGTQMVLLSETTFDH